MRKYLAMLLLIGTVFAVIFLVLGNENSLSTASNSNGEYKTQKSKGQPRIYNGTQNELQGNIANNHVKSRQEIKNEFKQNKKIIITTIEKYLENDELAQAKKLLDKYSQVLDGHIVDYEFLQINNKYNEIVTQNEIENVEEDEYEKLIDIYSRLFSINPDNKLYTEKLKEYTSIYRRKLLMQALHTRDTNIKLKMYKKLVKLCPHDQAYREEVRKLSSIGSDKLGGSQARAISDLELLAFHWSARGSYVTAEGRIKNISGRRLEGIQAVVEWEDGKGNFITSGSAVIEFNPLMPDQTSPFKVIERYNPEMVRALVNFKLIFGEKLQTYYGN